jgi:hypothetical protein
MINKLSDTCFACGKDGKLRFGSDGVWCFECNQLESWNSYHRRIKELKSYWNNTVLNLEEMGKGQGFYFR